ncbi:MAG TPA: NAD(P)/FAD-dependent oxidoreductase [Balneolaceae bacterium]|nr:NAD(P)/FAD-dependent oxidoreductase [Balneolaceae bacterium]
MKFNAVIIGSGPNGLAAGIRLAQQGWAVKIFERNETIGGGTRTKELTLPGFKHDVCSAIHPLAKASPFLKTLPLEKYGLEWIQPEVPVAHPLEDESCCALFRSPEETTEQLGQDGLTYWRTMDPFVRNWDKLIPQLLAPFNLLPDHPLLMARFGLEGLHSADTFTAKLRTCKARALFAGLAAHGILPFHKTATAAIGLVLGIAGHAVGWPFPKGGSQNLTKAMAEHFRSLGGKIETDTEITSLQQLPAADTIFFDITPKQILDLAEEKLPDSYTRKLTDFKYGSGVFKLDFALSDPIPWKDKICRKAGTIHLGNTYEEIARAEAETARGKHPDKPFVLVSQHSLFDKSRTPEGKHTAWAYCHVPNSSTKDMTDPIINQIERFAPGFRDCILDKNAMNTVAMQEHNPNYIGGDINGGQQDITQLFTRPAGLWDPYRILDTNMFICSSSTPPGGGVHGMCGYHAAESAIKNTHMPKWI